MHSAAGLALSLGGGRRVEMTSIECRRGSKLDDDGQYTRVRW